MQSKSTAATHPQHKRQQPIFVLAHQTDQIGIDAATQPYSNNRSAQLICYWLKYYRPCYKVPRVRHHQSCSKREREVQFGYHANADTIRFFTGVQ